MPDAFLPPHDEPRLREAVLGWFVRRHGAAWTAQDEAALQAWLAADPSRRAAWARWEAHWQAIGTLPAAGQARLRGGLGRDRAAPSRRRFLKPAAALAGVAALVLGAGRLVPGHLGAQPLFAQAFGSRRGELLKVTLPDGTRLLLDTATRLDVVFHRRQREVRLLDGQATFSVQPDAARPFHVLAGPLRVTVLGTRFAVRHTPGIDGAQGVRVAVEEGRVHVARADAASGTWDSAVDLAAGEQVAGDRQGRLAPVSPVPPEGIAPWRGHRVSFVDTPLHRALAELERYGDTGLVVRDPAAAALRLSGTFDPRDAATLRRVLPRALPVRLRERDGRTEVLPVR